MTQPSGIENVVRDRRRLLGWSQHDLAARSGLSRTGVGAIESGRLVPSTAAALALAAALGCRVEDLFRLRGGVTDGEWAWEPRGDSGRYWRAEVGGRAVLYPAEASPLGVILHDGTFHAGVPTPAPAEDRPDPTRTLVLACCDPAVGLLAAELARAAGVRLVVLGRSSQRALELLGAGLVHVAGVHLAAADGARNEAAAGPGRCLLRLADWEAGVAAAPAARLGSAGASAGPGLRWIGREAGSGARLCQDELLGDRPLPERVARDHRGVAEAVRAGWADVGACLRLAAEEAGLDFLPVRREAYQLCFAASLADDPRLRALVDVVRSARFRRAVGELPGYDSSRSGELVAVAPGG